MHHTLTIEQAQHFYPGQTLEWPITTREAHALLAAMGLEYAENHLAWFARQNEIVLAVEGRSCLWNRADVEAAAAHLARLGHFTKWAAGWQAFGVPLATAETARAAACAAYGVDSWRHFSININHPHTSKASVYFMPRRGAEQ